MKATNFLFSILFLAFSIPSLSQTKSINRFYLQTGGGGGTYNSGSVDISFQAIIKNKWSITISNQVISMKHSNIPMDYIPATSTTYILGIPFESTDDIGPMEMKTISLTAGRGFNITKKSWVTAEAGVSYVKGQKASFIPTDVTSDYYDFWLIGGSFSSSNYKTTIENKTSVGAMLRADFNWAIASFMGIGGGVFANINSIKSPIGFQLKLMVGDMGRKKE